MNKRFCRIFLFSLLTAVMALISACVNEAIEISAPKEVASAIKGNEGQIPVDVYMDATVSMRGYTTSAHGNLYSARDTRNSYFSFKGRMNRKAYCIMGLKCLGFYFLLGVFASFLVQEGSDGLGGFILLVATIAFAICNYSLTVRRLHDLNFSGWLAIIMFIPYVNLIAALFIILAPGTEGSNEYGEDPLRL